MVNRKALFFLAFIFIALLVVWLTPVYEAPPGEIAVRGQTMGTTYSIKYLDPRERLFKDEIDSILREFNQSLSTYISDSEISEFNRSMSVTFELPYFYPVLAKSREVYEKTGGAFNPAVMPLVNAWGFGPESSALPDSSAVDSLRQLVQFDAVIFDESSAEKDIEDLQLDFSAIAKGYGVDVIFEFLEGHGIDNLFVEIGGEVRCKGKNAKGELWKVGINVPDPESFANDIQAIVKIEDRALATSGNYRNFYVENGVMYAHTIDPDTGYPVRHTLLSASVFAPDCMTADAYATAMMVMGLDDSKAFLEQNPQLDAYLIYAGSDNAYQFYTTPGIQNYIIQ